MYKTDEQKAKGTVRSRKKLLQKDTKMGICAPRIPGNSDESKVCHSQAIEILLSVGCLGMDTSISSYQNCTVDGTCSEHSR